MQVIHALGLHVSGDIDGLLDIDTSLYSLVGAEFETHHEIRSQGFSYPFEYLHGEPQAVL